MNWISSICNLSHANFIAQLFHIPLKTADNPTCDFSDRELYDALAVLFAYVFLDIDTASSFGLRTAASEATKNVGAVVRRVCTAAKLDKFSSLKEMFGVESHGILTEYGAHLIKRLLDGGKSVDEVVWTIIPTMAAAVATQAQGVRLPN